MSGPISDRLTRPDEPAPGELSLGTSLSILRRYWKFALAVGVAVALLSHLATSLWTSQQPTRYEARFEVRYRAGTNVLAGLSRLVGRDLPSLQDRSTIETQVEILGGRELQLRALKHVRGCEELSPEDARARLAELGVAITHRSNTDIIQAQVSGAEKAMVQEFAVGLLNEYRHRDVRQKRAKDTDLRDYLKKQIVAHEKKLARFYEVISAHKEVAPLVQQRERALARIGETEEALVAEGRSRRNRRDALLSKYTEDHPQVIRAKASIQALEAIAQAESPEALAPLRVGAEAQWAALRGDAFLEAKRADELQAQAEKIRADIGERYKGLLRAGSDPEHVNREYRLAQETYEGLRRRMNQVDLSIQDVSSDIETLIMPHARRLVRGSKWRWALAAGLLCGLLGPFVLESLVVTSHTVEDVERISGLPVLAVVPKLDGSQTNGAGVLVRGSAASDELRLLRTNIEAALDYPARRLVLVAGAEPGEGKSMVAVNLASVYAEMGVPTLLVDLDLRRPVDHELLKVRRSPGVSEVIRDGISWKRAVQIPEIDNLHVLPAGSPVEDSGGLLATVRLAEVLSEMREVFSVVICDSPAMTAVADASLVARRADAVVLVYALATTPQRALARTIGMLTTTRANLLGVVANDIRGMSSKRSYRYRHYYRRKQPEA